MDGSRNGIAPEHSASSPSGKRLGAAERFRSIRNAVAKVRDETSLWYRDQDDDEFAAQLRTEQLREIRRRLPANAAASALCALLLIIAVWDQHSTYLLIPWGLAVWLLSAASLRQWCRLRERGSHASPSVRTLRRSAIASGVLGGLWGLAALSLCQNGLQGGEIVGLLVTAGMAAGAAVGLASLPQSSLAFVLASLLPCSLGFAMNATLPYTAMSVATLVFASYLIHMAFTTYRMLIRLLRARVQQDRLSMALTRSQKMAEDAYREIENDLVAARRAQLRVMPGQDHLTDLWKKSGVRVEAHFEPCMHLGGDHWSIICPEPDTVRFCVSDFAGHGIVAALNSFKLVALLARMTPAMMRPDERAERLNRDLCKVLETGQYATVLLAEINIGKGRFKYVGCGGPAPMMFRAGEHEVVEPDTKGLPMGISPEATYEERQVALSDDQLLLIFSDALTEAKDDDDRMLGRDWIRETARAHIAAHGYGGIVKALIDEFRSRSNERLADDLTVIAMWYDPDNAPVAEIQTAAD